MWFPGLWQHPLFTPYLYTPALCEWAKTSGGRDLAAAWPSVWLGAAPERLSYFLLSAPTLSPTLSISPLKIFLSLFFLFSLFLLPIPLSSFSHLSSHFLLSLHFSPTFLILFSVSSVVSTPVPSLWLSFPFLFHPFPSLSSPQHPGTCEGTSLTRNTPTPASSISCDGSGGSGSPCAPPSPVVRSPTSVASCRTSPGRIRQGYPWEPSRYRPLRSSLCTCPARQERKYQDSASLIS